MRVLFIILTIISLSSGADVERIMNDPCFMMEKSKGPCSYSVNGRTYFIHADGRIEFEVKSEYRVLAFDLPKYFEIESVTYEEIDQDIIFNLSVTDYESGSTIIARFSPEKGKVLWQAGLCAFNSSPLLVNGNAIYVGGIGLVSKIDASNGKVLWLHKGLYENDTQAYNSFSKPSLEGEVVIFRENKVSTATYSGVREVVVDDETGKVLSK